jgi:hypothetical protein
MGAFGRIGHPPHENYFPRQVKRGSLPLGNLGRLRMSPVFYLEIAAHLDAAKNLEIS